MLDAVVDAYRRTRKPKDIIWNRYVARPLAAVVVVPLARTRITPNQITLATLLVFLAGAAVMAFIPGWGALVGSAAIIEFSYVLDCADGQLARLKGMSSPVGAYLDFLMDELRRTRSSQRSRCGSGCPNATPAGCSRGWRGSVSWLRPSA